MTRKVALSMGLILGGLASGAVAAGVWVFPTAVRAEVEELGRWTVEPDFKNKEARSELSGAVCAGAPGSREWCLAVNDEKQYAQFFSIKNTTLVPSKRIRLLPKEEGCVKFDEIDAEAVAYDNGYVYVTGSHGLSRKRSEFHSSVFFVFRFPVDKRTGKPGFAFDRKSVADDVQRTDRLRFMIQRNGTIGPFAERPLAVNGVNIEGIAVAEGLAHFGFRAPTLNGSAFVLTVPIDGLFGHARPNAKLSKLDLGYGMGVRDLAATKAGVLVLAGPAADEAGAASVFLWDPKSGDLADLGTLPVEEDLKGEALLVLNEAEAGAPLRFDVLVLFDGQENGEPRAFRLTTNR